MGSKSIRRQLVDEIRALAGVGDKQQRFRPMLGRLRVYEAAPSDYVPEGPDDEQHAVPVAWRDKVYGGLYDTVLREYVDAPVNDNQVPEFRVHAGQLELLEYDPAGDGVSRVMALGGPGSGKTRLLVIKAILFALDHPNTIIGIIGASNERTREVFNHFMGVATPRGYVPPGSEGVTDDQKHGLVVHFWNGAKFEFVTAKAPSRAVGTKIQGRSWHQAFIDESQNIMDQAQADIDERGRAGGCGYCVWESATNFGLRHFLARVDNYKNDPTCRIFRLNPLRNPFVDPKYWERFTHRYSPNEYKRRILAEDVPPEQLVYGGFASRENKRPSPSLLWDVTKEITAKRYGGAGWSWVVGTDFGVLCTASIWLKAFRDPQKREDDLQWWAMWEILSGSHSTAAHHARRLAEFVHPSDFIVIADPGINTRDADKSDYELTRREGVTIRPAAPAAIRVKHRVSMMNALFCDAKGRRRLYLDCDEKGAPKCPELFKSLISMEPVNGDPEGMKKDYRDPSHYPAACAFGVFPWERIRGETTFEAITGGVPLDPLVKKAHQIENRRRFNGH
jgi:predicted SAM-dependent methyltransferase